MGNICCSAQGGGTVESDHKQANGHTAVPGQKDLTFDDSKVRALMLAPCFGEEAAVAE